MAPYFTTLSSKADYTTLVTPNAGKTILVAYWPGDATSSALIQALKKHLPKHEYEPLGIVDAYRFDAYALPDLAGELDITFVPMLMWFMDGVMDAVVWNPGVAVEGESVERGVKRVVERIRGSHEVGARIGDSDSDW